MIRRRKGIEWREIGDFVPHRTFHSCLHAQVDHFPFFSSFCSFLGTGDWNDVLLVVGGVIWGLSPLSNLSFKGEKPKGGERS